MSLIKGHSAPVAGFTMLELAVAASISLILMAAILSAYLFLGRNLIRLTSLEQQEKKARLALTYFSKDVGAATMLTTATVTISSGTTTYAQFVLVPPTGGNVTYTYDTSIDKLTRTDSSGTIELLTDLASFSINYLTITQVANGTAFSTTATAPANPLSVKAVQFQFATAVGTAANGTQATYTAMSPRVLLRNRTILQ